MNPIVVLGIINILLLIFQLLTGTGVIYVKNKTHKIMAFVLLFSVLIHAALAIKMFYFD